MNCITLAVFSSIYHATNLYETKELETDHYVRLYCVQCWPLEIYGHSFREHCTSNKSKCLRMTVKVAADRAG